MGWDGSQESKRRESIYEWKESTTKHHDVLLVQLLSGWRPSRKNIPTVVCVPTCRFQASGICLVPPSQCPMWGPDKSKDSLSPSPQLEETAQSKQWRDWRTLPENKLESASGEAVNQVCTVSRQCGSQVIFRVFFCCLHLFSVTWYCVWTDSIGNLGKPWATNIFNNLSLRDPSALMSASVMIFLLDSVIEVGILVSVEAAHAYTVPNTCLQILILSDTRISLPEVWWTQSAIGKDWKLEWAALLP